MPKLTLPIDVQLLNTSAVTSMSVMLTHSFQGNLDPHVMFQELQDQVQRRANLLLAGRF